MGFILFLYLEQNRFIRVEYKKSYTPEPKYVQLALTQAKLYQKQLN